MAQTEYEVRVAGVVSAEQLLDLGAVNATTEFPSTVLYGEIRDEDELFVLLTRLRSFGLEVVEVRRTPAVSPAANAADDAADDPEDA